jgi:hypothetical protein
MDYTPDLWHILKIRTPKETIYKVLAGWQGGYTQGDSWKINSGITKYELVNNYIEFAGYSGSVYRCHVESEKLSMLMQKIFETYSKEIKANYDDSYGIELINFEDFKLEFPNG